MRGLHNPITGVRLSRSFLLNKAPFHLKFSAVELVPCGAALFVYSFFFEEEYLQHTISTVKFSQV